MPYNFEKLTAAVTAAMKAGQEAADSKPDDGGTCNMDAVILRIPRINEQKVVEALQAGGAGHTEKNDWGWHGIGYMINPQSGGQGNRRSRAAEAIAKSLKEAGYDASVYYQMD